MNFLSFTAVPALKHDLANCIEDTQLGRFACLSNKIEVHGIVRGVGIHGEVIADGSGVNTIFHQELEAIKNVEPPACVAYICQRGYFVNPFQQGRPDPQCGRSWFGEGFCT